MHVELAELAAQHSDEQKKNAATEHLHSGREQPRLWKLGVTRPERPDRPRERSEYQNQRSQEWNIAVASNVAGPDQHDDSDEAEHQSGEYQSTRPPSGRSRPLDDHQPEGKDRDEQRRKSRGNVLLGPDYGPVSAEQEERSRDHSIAPVQTSRLRSASVSRPGVEQGTGYQKASSAHDEGRNGLDCVPDREVRGSPYQIDRSERGDDLAARGFFVAVVQGSKI